MPIPISVSRDQVAIEDGYDPEQGTTASLEWIGVAPGTVISGSSLALKARWKVLARDATIEVPFSEEWEMRKQTGKSTMPINSRTGKAKQGRLESEVQFKAPSDWPLGVYVATYNLEIADQNLSRDSRFSIVERKHGQSESTRQIVWLSP